MTTEDCTSSSCTGESSADKIEAMKAATDLLSQGKRSMVCGEIPKAVNFCEEAVQLLVKSCGELSRDCAEAYFCCGSALLELGRMETNVLGVALEGVDVEEEKDVEDTEQFEKPPEDDGEERQKLREDVYEAMAEGDREKELNKCSQEKTQATPIECDPSHADTSSETASMETDTVADKTEVTAPQPDKTNDGDSVTDGGCTDGSKQDEPVTNSVVEMAEDNKRADEQPPCTDSKPDDDKPAKAESASNEDKQDESVDDSAKATEVSKSSASDSRDTPAVSAESRQEEIVENAVSTQQQNVGSTEEVDPAAKTAASQEEKTSGENKTEEQMDASATVGEELSTTGNIQEKTTDNAASCTASEADSGTVTKDDADKSDSASQEQPAGPVDSTVVGDEEKERCAEKIVTEAVKEAYQKLADEGAKSPDHSAEATSQVSAEENADVEMADEAEDEAADETDDDDADFDNAENEDNGEEKAEDVPNFQLAWEYLELAKVIYLKSEAVDDQLKAAECHIKLGELSMETEQYTTAAGDLETALQIQQKHLPANDRLIAETHYQLGLAYSFGCQYEQSIQQYTAAIGVLESKIESLRQLVQEKEADENKENVEVVDPKHQNEIKELQDLIPEIRNKIEDVRLEAREVEHVKQMAKEAMGVFVSTQEANSATLTNKVEAVGDSGDSLKTEEQQEASNIGHLMRKKRKPDTDLADSEMQEVKKIRSDTLGDCSGDASVASQGPASQTLQTDAVVVAEVVKPAELLAGGDASAAAPVVEESEMSSVDEAAVSKLSSEKDGAVSESLNTQPEASCVSETPVVEPVSGTASEVAVEPAEMETVNEASRIEPKSEQTEIDTASGTSKPEPVNGETEMETINEAAELKPAEEANEISSDSKTAVLEPVNGDSDMVVASETTEVKQVNEVSESTVNKTSEIEPVKGESEVSSVNKPSEIEPVKEDAEVSSVNNTSEIEPVKGDAEVSSVNNTSEIEPVKGDADVGSVNKTSEIEPVKGDADVSSVNKTSEIEPVKGESEMDVVSESAESKPISESESTVKVSEIEPANGESEMETVSETSKQEPGESSTTNEVSTHEPINGDCEMETVEASRLDAVNGESEMDTLCDTSKTEPMNGNSEALKDVTVDGADNGTVTESAKKDTIVVKESCGINHNEEVSMETESTAS